MYAQAPPNEPQALEAWFYPGDNTGQQFVYPKRKAAELSSTNAVQVPSTDDAQAYPDANGQNLAVRNHFPFAFISINDL